MEQLREEEQTKVGGAQRVENQEILRVRTQRAGQPWQVWPPLWASAFCLGLGSRPFPMCTDRQQPRPWIQCWLKPSGDGLGYTNSRADRWKGHQVRMVVVVVVMIQRTSVSKLSFINCVTHSGAHQSLSQ